MSIFGDTYEVIGEIGSGGGGTVYKAYHKRLQKVVAVKKLHSDLTNINVRAEADILKNLKHSYLPQLYDFIQTYDGIYTVMEYIEGYSFKDYLDHGQQFKERDVIIWFKQLCDALGELHGKRQAIIHGDIKPANIMLTNEGDICLIDFNVASVFAGTKTDISGYTPAYAAPEQINLFNELVNLNTMSTMPTLQQNNGNHTTFTVETDRYHTYISVLTDIYSLGATMYHIISGRPPRRGQEPIPNIRSVCNGINEHLALIIEKCMQPNPADRYQSVWEIKKALDNIYLSSKRYRDLIFKQNLFRGLAILGIFGFSLMSYAGYQLMGQEKLLKYEDAIRQERDAAEDQDEDDLEDAFLEAVSYKPSYADAYEIKAQYLYDTNQLEEAEMFIINDALPYVENGVGKANICYLLSDCYMEEENYSDAQDYIEMALENDDRNPKIYSNYAVCLAKQGKIQKAKKELDEAIERDLSEDCVLYTNAEIYYAMGEFDSAEEEMLECLSITDDASMMLKGYLLLMNICEEEKTEASLTKKVSYADQALEDLKEYQKIAILEEKAQALIDLGNMTGNPEYSFEAIKTFEQIIDTGFGTFLTYQNIVVLYQKEAQYDDERRVLEEMLDVFGDDYRIYKYFAFMEVSVQNSLPEADRDYSQFQFYYQRAFDLYKNHKGEDDPDMNHLDNLYQQAHDGGWF